MIHAFEKNDYRKLWQRKKLSIGHESYDPKDIKNGYLINVRNFDGQTFPHPTVAYNAFLNNLSDTNMRSSWLFSLFYDLVAEHLCHSSNLQTLYCVGMVAV